MTPDNAAPKLSEDKQEAAEIQRLKELREMEEHRCETCNAPKGWVSLLHYESVLNEKRELRRRLKALSAKLGRQGDLAFKIQEMREFIAGIAAQSIPHITDSETCSQCERNRDAADELFDRHTEDSANEH